MRVEVRKIQNTIKEERSKENKNINNEEKKGKYRI